jgi:hypothetical protein
MHMALTVTGHSPEAASYNAGRRRKATPAAGVLQRRPPTYSKQRIASVVAANIGPCSPKSQIRFVKSSPRVVPVLAHASLQRHRRAARVCSA